MSRKPHLRFAYMGYILEALGKMQVGESIYIENEKAQKMSIKQQQAHGLRITTMRTIAIIDSRRNSFNKENHLQVVELLKITKLA